MSGTTENAEHIEQQMSPELRSSSTWRSLVFVGIVAMIGVAGLWAGSTQRPVSSGDAESVASSVAMVPQSVVTLAEDALDTTGIVETPENQNASGSVEQPTESEDDRMRREILGSWQQQRFGSRLLTVQPDGKATMVIRPDSVWAFAYGERIDLEMFWSIEDGRIDYGYNGGTPADKVELASKTWGDHWIEEIVELTDSRLVLLAEDGQTRSEWERASTDRKPPSVSKDRSQTKK
ncbi:MAG: hypothetical protein ACYTGL_25805 [Planctomycetota bacterium]|jgi:hypothetical protein